MLHWYCGWVKLHEAPLDKLSSQNLKAIALLDSGILPFCHSVVCVGLLFQTLWTVMSGSIPTMQCGSLSLLRPCVPTISRKQGEIFGQCQIDFAQQMLQASQQYESSGNQTFYWSYHNAYQYLEQSAEP